MNPPFLSSLRLLPTLRPQTPPPAHPADDIHTLSPRPLCQTRITLPTKLNPILKPLRRPVQMPRHMLHALIPSINAMELGAAPGRRTGHVLGQGAAVADGAVLEGAEGVFPLWVCGARAGSSSGGGGGAF